MATQIMINKRNVDAIENDDWDRFYWDVEIPGFDIHVRSSRQKYFKAEERLRAVSIFLVIISYTTNLNFLALPLHTAYGWRE